MRRALMMTCAFALLGAGCSESHEGDGDAGDIVLMDAGGGGGGTDAGGGGGTDAGEMSMTDSGGGGGIDAGTTTPTDSGPRVGADGSVGTLDCMGMACDSATEQCCITGGPGGASASCIPAGEMCMGATADCDGPEDCASGETCCARAMGFSIVTSCSSETCGGGFTSFELCHDAADCTDTTQMCCPIMRGGFSAAFCSAMCGFGPPP